MECKDILTQQGTYVDSDRMIHPADIIQDVLYRNAHIHVQKDPTRSETIEKATNTEWTNDIS